MRGKESRNENESVTLGIIAGQAHIEHMARCLGCPSPRRRAAYQQESLMIKPGVQILFNPTWVLSRIRSRAIHAARYEKGKSGGGS